MTARICRIRNDALRIFLVTLWWPTIAVHYWASCVWHCRWPTPGFLGSMYNVACSGALVPPATEV